ncbi:MAG: ArsR family transcriptional regulator [Flaviaesturariibacter sp.]|nr:ArsR family transcriptional regulator [Flaviaesturariibacter sp.]
MTLGKKQSFFLYVCRTFTNRMDNRSWKVLIADDEPDILEILKYNLSKEGYSITTAADGNEAVATALQLVPDLVVLDIMMPGKTGVEVCEILRAQPALKDTLIMFLTALNDEATQIKGLTTGADDYISKPISPKVFVSKVQSLLRRARREDHKALTVNGLTIDPERFIVQYEGKDMLLAKKEFELLHLLATKPGRVFLRNEILSQVWGADVIVGDRTIDVHIRKIRQKLGIDCITTVKGVGYKFEM